MPRTLCTFNANNLFVRYRFGKKFPGDVSDKSKIAKAMANVWGYLPLNLSSMYEVFSAEIRDLAAQCLRQGQADNPANYPVSRACRRSRA